ncbi:MAG: hypothetical protein M3R27_05925 [Bacteroidota bacterium]|nr:hypothetical protein [Bacteroidota bacterium]
MNPTEFKELGFEVIDLGSHWEYNKGDFQILQFKTPFGKLLDPVFIVHSKVSKHIRVPNIKELKTLYKLIEGKELICS